jgi:transcriptional regulator with XRE-family HTH domain
MDEEKLNQKQEMAIELALTGMSDSEIARRIKVSRQWVNAWRNHNTVFIDALEERRKTLRERYKDNINGLVEKAIDVMKNALDDEDPKIRLQAVKLVLNTAALKDSMKEKKEVNEVEESLRQLAEAMGMAGKELGYTEPGKG